MSLDAGDCNATKQDLQGSGAGWGYETQHCRGAPTRTISRETQSD